MVNNEGDSSRVVQDSEKRGKYPRHRRDPRGKTVLPRFLRIGRLAVKRYFLDSEPVFANAFAPAMFLSALLYMRSPLSNCIFDEQEALLANPYVNGSGLLWRDAVHRDFWGLLPTRSIGSYRPLPNVIWRALWPLGNSPWLLHWINVIVHAACAALITSFVWSVTKRRGVSWWTGGVYVCFALLTEAVSGVVGLADVLGALFLIAALHALRRSLWVMGPLVFLSVLAGLFSKESELVAIPLVAAAALYLSRSLHERRPLSLLRASIALLSSTAALVLYTELRKRWFPVDVATELKELPEFGGSTLVRALHAFLHWFRQPKLPADPMNNPLAAADFPHRVAGALRVYASGFQQLLVPLRLSGDYSFPAEDVPTKLVFPKSVAGALLMVLPPIISIFGLLVVVIKGVRSRWTNLEAPARVALLGLLWFPIAYFPHSNIPTILPTVRAERFWVIPAIGVAFVLGALIAKILQLRDERLRDIATLVIGAWFAMQIFQARSHALDYTDDLAFWRATAHAVPNSAKARLNHGVMLGARQRLAERLVEGAAAMRLAPKWSMAHVYQGDTLCRMDRPDEAWPHYKRGFELGTNEPNLIALGLQCLWDHQRIEPHREELTAMADGAPGSWLAFLANDILENGDQYKGVQPKYRPRGYNEGPKK